MKTNVSTQTPPETIEEHNIKSLWTALQVAEKQIDKRGLQFGQAMYDCRERHSASGRRTDLVSKSEKSETRLETFEEFCDRLAIPRATAYRWIAKYEESIGTRLPKPTPDTPSEPPYEVESSAQANSRDVSPSEDSARRLSEDLEPSADAPPLSTNSEVETAATLESETTPTSTSTGVVTTEARNREQLGFLVKRLNSLSVALQQVADDKAKWSEYAEYAEVVSAGEKIAGLVKGLAK